MVDIKVVVVVSVTDGASAEVVDVLKPSHVLSAPTELVVPETMELMGLVSVDEPRLDSGIMGTTVGKLCTGSKTDAGVEEGPDLVAMVRDVSPAEGCEGPSNEAVVSARELSSGRGKNVVVFGMEDVTVCTMVLVPAVAVCKRVVGRNVDWTQPRIPICSLVMVSERFDPPETTPWVHASVG